MGASIFWVEGERLLVGVPRFLLAARHIVKHADLVPNICIVRLDLQITLVLVNRPALFPKLLADDAEIVISVKVFGIKLDRLLIFLLRARQRTRLDEFVGTVEVLGRLGNRAT